MIVPNLLYFYYVYKGKTNIRQRGDISSSSLKMGRIIAELERIYGIKQGNNQRTPTMSESSKTQEDIAKELGMSVDSLNNYKKLTTLIPELQTMVNDDNLSVSKKIAKFFNKLFSY